MRSSITRSLGLFLLLQGALLLIASGRARTVDEHSLHFMAESMVARGSVAVPQLVELGSFYGKPSLRGEAYAPYSPGQPVAASIYLRALGPWFRASASKPLGEPMLLANQAATSLLSTTMIALTAVLFMLAAEALGIRPFVALASSLLLVASTPLLPYSKYGFSEPSLAALVALVLYGLVQWDLGKAHGLWLAGIGVALAVSVKLAVGGLLFGAVGLALLSRPEGRNLQALTRFAVAPVCALALHLTWNWVRFDDMWDLGYPAAAELGRRLNDFDTPLAVGLFGLLLSPGKGLLFFAPGVIAAALGLRAAFQKSPSAVITGLVFFVASLLLYSRYSAWEGGYCVGPRYLLPALPFLWLGLPFVLSGERRKFTLALCLAGLVLQGPAVATSFIEDQAPRGRYYDATYHYQIGYTPAGQWRLAARYLPGLFTGEAWNQPLGLGLDFWFVFLVRAGFGRDLVLSWFAVASALVVSGGALLARESRGATR